MVVVGSGVAGLTAALECRERLGPQSRVMVVTKDVVAAGSTRWAQGGIASVQAEGDSVAEHVSDTLVAGAGLCEPAAVDLLVREGPDEVATLVERGTQFDLDAAGRFALTREGGHHRNRIAHAGGDATGAEIERALVAAVQTDEGVEIVEQALVLDLLPAVTQDGSPAVAGVTLHVLGEGSRQGVGAVRSRAVVLATGGIGQIYAVTTNPPVSTGDGVAAALRAGARLRDVEFIQFHPTVLFLGTGARGQLPLVSEAVRGEGGLLVNSAGERFMVGQHELAELAPRDVVAKGIMKEMAREGTDHVYVDGRMLGEETWRVRFPTILHSCRQAGIDPVADLIPVAPAAHYFCGGVETDLRGATTLAGLYACGEVASSGVHGANRLASNSLLEGLVFAARIAGALAEDLPPAREPVDDPREAVARRPVGRPGAAAHHEPRLRWSAEPRRPGPGDEEADPPRRAPHDRDRARGVGGVEPPLRRRRGAGLGPAPRGVPGRPLARRLRRPRGGVGAPPRRRGRRRGRSRAPAYGGGRGRVRRGHDERTDEHGSGTMSVEISSLAQAEAYVASVGLDVEALAVVVAEALGEDLGGRGVLAPGAGRGVDVTSVATVPADAVGHGELVVRRPGVVAGLPVAAYVVAVVLSGGDRAGPFRVEVLAADGDDVATGDVLARLEGGTRGLLTAERVALNLLTLTSGVATATKAWVDALAGTATRVRDTRKTVPGLRMLQKYAVRVGGGVNHRMSLADAALVKDNHVVAAGGVVAAYERVRAMFGDLWIQVEVTTPEQARDVVAAGATDVLLDNMSLAQMSAVVAELKGRAQFEASGGLTLASAASVAATGVDFIAVGAITHSAPIMDIALDLG